MSCFKSHVNIQLKWHNLLELSHEDVYFGDSMINLVVVWSREETSESVVVTCVSSVVAVQNGAHSKRLGRVPNPGTFIVFLFQIYVIQVLCVTWLGEGRDITIVIYLLTTRWHHTSLRISLTFWLVPIAARMATKQFFFPWGSHLFKRLG